ncbi:MAG: extracellular solute-binding protein [Dehalococcoidia bacterium]|nr:extracellular solute-binding protein [Dehalococcoidia bacterium]
MPNKAVRMALAAILALMTFLVACAPAAAPTPTPAPKAAATAPSAPVTAAPAAAPSVTASQPTASTGALQQLIDGARKEGVVRANLSSTLGEKGAQQLIDALNKKYNLSLKLEFTTSANMPSGHAQLMTELTSGGAPSWDVIMGTVMHPIELANRGMLDTFDWTGAFPSIPKQLVYHNGGTLGIGVSYALPIYNPNLVKPADVPRKWEDLLDPKWKGKLVVPSPVQVWARLAQSWGEDRVDKLVAGLAQQDPIYALYPQVTQRVSSGEYPIAAMMDSIVVLPAQARGEPVKFANDVTPAIAQYYVLSVPKKAAHPNAAKLFAAFELDPEAQKIWWQATGLASELVPGSPMVEQLKGRDVFFSTIDFEVKEGGRLVEKYTKLSGQK